MRAVRLLVLAIVLGAAGFGLVLAASHLRPAITACLIAAILGVGAAWLSGNLRLTLLWGLLLTAPLDLCIQFMIIGPTGPISHLGGAASFRIEIGDFFIIGLGAFLLRDLRNRRCPLAVPRPFRWLLLLVLLGLVNVVLGPWRTVALHEIVRMVKAAALGILVANEVTSPRRCRHAALALSAGVIFQSLIAMIQFGFDAHLGLEILGENSQKGLEIAAAGSLTSGRFYRVGALMGHPNLFGIYLAMLMPAALALVFSRVPLLHKVTHLLAVVLGQLAIVLTLSRAAWLGYGGALLLVMILTAVHRQVRRRYLLGRLAMLALMTGGLLVMSPAILTRIFESQAQAVLDRWEWIDVAWRMIAEKPVFGFGLNTYVFEMPPYTMYQTVTGVTAKYGDWWPVVHNVFLITWVEQGIVGLAVLLAAFGSIVRIGVRNLRSSDDVFFAVNLGCLGAVFALLVDGLVSFSMRTGADARIFWILIGLMAAIDRTNRIGRGATGPKPPARTVPAAAAAS